LANKSNNYLLDRQSQRHGHSSTGVDGIAMQDASIQESMGPIQDRTKEHLCATDTGIIMTRKILLRAAKAAAEGGAVPATEPETHRVLPASIELDKNAPLPQGAKHGLYAALGTDPLSVKNRQHRNKPSHEKRQ